MNILKLNNFRIVNIIILVLIVNVGYSQIDCKKYLDKKCDTYGKPFKQSGQSKVAIFEIGQKSKMSITIYKGFEYRVSLCAEKTLKGIFFRLRDNDASKSIIYDSSVEEIDYLEKFFYSAETKNIIIEVIVPEGDQMKEQLDYEEQFGCVGVNIEYYKRKEIGL